MNQLFAVADYGIHYRALSKTGQVLGSQKDTGEFTQEKQQKIPRFLLAKKQKMEAKKLQQSLISSTISTESPTMIESITLNNTESLPKNEKEKPTLLQRPSGDTGPPQ